MSESVCPECRLPLNAGEEGCPACTASSQTVGPLICPVCRKLFTDGSDFCDKDRERLVPAEKARALCVTCGSPYPPETLFCILDGSVTVI